MSDTRSAILQRLAAALGHGTTSAESTAVVERLQARARGPQPAWVEPSRQRFVARLERAAASCSELADAAELPEAVVAYLTAQGLPASLTLAPHPLLAGLAWPTTLRIERRAARPEDRVALSFAFCGIAETGSLVLLSGPQTPTSLNFLPDDFLCLLPADRIVARMEDAWDLLRAECVGMPRAVNIVTGPSRTADVEQTIQLGAHGPRRLHVWLLADGVT